MLSQQLKDIIVSVLKSHSIKRASLFGSFARGEEQENSDIDILVEATEKMGLFDFLRIEQELKERTSKKVDLVEFSAIKNSIRENVLKNTIPLI